MIGEDGKVVRAALRVLAQVTGSLKWADRRKCLGEAGEFRFGHVAWEVASMSRW